MTARNFIGRTLPHSLAASEPVSAPAWDTTPSPVVETATRAVLRHTLGAAYALHPARIRHVPALLALTAQGLLQGGKSLPDPQETYDAPDTFAGLVADLTPETYLKAQRMGFFPWCHCPPLKWWTRKERAVLRFDNAYLSKRTLRILRQGKFRITFDQAFPDVLRRCAEPRPYNWHGLTWLTPRMAKLYMALHEAGHAHSFEAWNDDGELVGGGFGVAAGRTFTGDSMFSAESNASKIAASVFYHHLAKWGFALVDGRDPTPVLLATGYKTMPRAEFEALMAEHAMTDYRVGKWTIEDAPISAATWLTEAKRVRLARTDGITEDD